MSAFALKADCSSNAFSYLAKDVSGLGLAGNWTVEAEVFIPSGTFTALASDDFTAYLIEVDGGIHNERIFVTGYQTDGTPGSFSGGQKNLWTTTAPGNPVPSFAADICTTFSIQWNGTHLIWKKNGVQFYLYAAFGMDPLDEIDVGGIFGNNRTDEFYYVTNVTVKDSGGSTVFSDDFASGDFSNWDSVRGDCFIVANPCAPTAPFRIDASPATVNVFQGGPGGTSTITSTLLSGSPEPISLRILTILPAGVTDSFTPSTISDDGGTATLLLAASSSSPAGSYPLTVQGDDGMGNTAATTVTLVISVQPPGIHIAS